MTKAIFLSVFVHIVLITASLYIFNINNQEQKYYKKISLNHIILKSQKPQEQNKKIQKPTQNKKLKQNKKTLQNKKQKVITKAKSLKKIKHSITKKGFKKAINKKLTKSKKFAKSKKQKTKTTLFKAKKKSRKTKKNITYFETEQFLSKNLNKIYQAIQRAKTYPLVAKRLNIQGVVNISFTLLPSGKVINLQTYSAHPILQKAAKKTIIKASQNFPKPKSKVNISLKLNYKLF
jgi:protein TonB